MQNKRTNRAQCLRKASMTRLASLSEDARQLVTPSTKLAVLFFLFFFWKEIRYLHWVAPSSAALSRSSARRRRKNRKHMALTSPLRDPPKFKNFRHTRDCWSSHWPGSCKIKLHVGCKQRPMRVASSRREADKCTCRKRCASFLKKKKTIFWSY